MRQLDRKVSEAIRRFELLQDGDRILVAVSGGKDSTCLLEVLAARRGWVRERYELAACHVVHPGCTGPELTEALARQCRELEVGLQVVRSETEHGCGTAPSGEPAAVAAGTSPCFHCAWERRRLLFQTAAAQGCRLVALGHHLDDLAETVLLNLFFRGELSTMYPRQSMFDGQIVIIRPLALVEERVLARVARLVRPELPTVHCAGEATGQRRRMKELIAEMRRTCPGIKANLVRPILSGWDPAQGGHRGR